MLGILATGMTNWNMEAVAEMPASLINIEFERMLYILDEQYEGELFLMNEREKKCCVGAAKSEPYLMYYVDGCDFALRIAKHKWMYITKKKNIKSGSAVRAQILIDAFWGLFRGVEVDCAGLANDQGMLVNSAWNQAPGILTNENEYVGGDSGYWDTQYINIVKPIAQEDLEENPKLKSFNTQFI